MIIAASDIAALEVGYLHLPVPPTGAVDDGFVAAAIHAGRSLPSDVSTALNEFRANSHPTGVLLVRHLPLGLVPDTPPSPHGPVVKDRVSEFTLLTIASRLGEPVGYLPEHGGDVVQNIVPVRSAAARQTSTSSDVALEFHTETAFHPHKPRYLALLCLRGDAQAATLFCSVTEALAQLSDETAAILRQPRFRTRPDASFLTESSTGGEFGPALPILAGTTAQPTFTFDADLMVGVDPTAQRALEGLRDAVRQAHRGVVLEAGDLLIIDNDVAVHGRSPFTPQYDGTDRWLQRTFIVDDLDASANERRGRIITTTFA